MVSYSLVFRYGLARFIKDARSAGFSGLILPDLPLPEAETIVRQVQHGGLETILLVAPSTSAPRRAEIASLCSGFIYYLSVSGITGERDRLPEDLETNLRELRGVTDVPICVGFGVHTREQVQQLHGFADGAIVGTAFVRRMKQHLHEGPNAIAAALEEYCRILLGSSPG
jgi:tryptophan synthase alpha chain